MTRRPVDPKLRKSEAIHLRLTKLEKARLEQLCEQLLFRSVSEVIREACNQYRNDVVPAVALGPGGQAYVEGQTSFLVKVPQNVKNSQTQPDDNQK